MNKKLEEENKQNEENHDKSIDNDKEPDPRINFESFYNKSNENENLSFIDNYNDYIS